MSTIKQESDWEVTEQGLYIATRGFLMRRGYCCANRCRNCPYINWRGDDSWQPTPVAWVKRARVSPKACAGARAMLEWHEQQLPNADETERRWHSQMIEHYSTLLERWRS